MMADIFSLLVAGTGLSCHGRSAVRKCSRAQGLHLKIVERIRGYVFRSTNMALRTHLCEMFALKCDTQNAFSTATVRLLIALIH